MVFQFISWHLTLLTSWRIFDAKTCLWFMTNYLSSGHFFTSWYVLDFMTNFLTSWRIFDIMTHFTNFLTSWQVFLRHYELFDIIPCLSLTNFLTSWRSLCHDVCLRSWRIWDVKAYFLTWWRSFWRDDVFLTSWHVFDIMTCFWRPDEVFDFFCCHGMF